MSSVTVDDTLPSPSSLASGSVLYRTQVVGAETRIASQEVRAFLGLPEGGDGDRDWWQNVHPADLPGALTQYETLLHGRGSMDAEYRIVSGDGSVHWLRDRAVVNARDIDGRVTAVMGLLEEVSERTALERELRESQRRYRQLFESIDAGFCIIQMLYDDDGHPNDYLFIEVNPAFERHSGMYDAPGRRMREIAPNHEDFWFEFYGEVARVGEPKRIESYARELDRWYDVYAFRFNDAELHQVAVLFSDVSGRKRTEETLQAIDRRKTEFIATLAHELRNPLAPISAGLQALTLGGSDPATAGKAIAMIERQVEQMTHLLDDLLDINRINLGKITLRIERMDLGELVQHTVHSLHAHYQRQNRRLTCTLPERPLRVEADRTRLTQILGNLLNNAAKFTGEGGHVQVVLEREGGQAVLRVRDDGIGIAPSQLERIFELFAQVEDDNVGRSSFGGLGVGIALAKQLAELHGGQLTATSEGIGKGAEFTLRIPAMAGTETEAPMTKASDGDTAASALRVLVVDDNRDAADSIAMVMELLGHQVDARYGGLEGYEAAQSLRPQVVFMDIGMPGLDGHEICRRIRAQDWGRDMRLVALTGWGADEDRQRTREAGFDHHLVKPVTAASLKEALASIRTN